MPFDIKDQFAFGIIPTLGEGIGALAMPIFSIASTLVIFYIIIGAFKFLTSAGDKGAIQEGQRMIFHGIIGFVLLIVMFLILQFIPQFFELQGFSIIK